MIERRNEFKQGAIAAVLSAAALAGSLYVSKALDYRNVFIPGTVINGENAAERTVSEMEDVFGEYSLDLKFRDGEELTVTNEDIDYHYVPDGSLEKIFREQNPLLWIRGWFEKLEYSVDVLGPMEPISSPSQ